MKHDSTILISYPLSASTPVYLSSPKVDISQHKSIQNGDTSNSSHLAFSNHTGTHIDLPRHFCADGAVADDLLSAQCIFSPATCIDLSHNDCIEIRPEDLEPHLSDTFSSEALLIKTGMAKKRKFPAYCSDYPFIHPDVPEFLRRNYPKLKVFCIDTLSVANPSHREQGRDCHRNFLCGRPAIMIMEDANLSDSRIEQGAWVLKVFPLILGNLDAVPVIAILEPYE
ncbi:MAG: cyclase family protein [Methanoregula sp.]|nr:cyclase family protein [Methanoregula sp.]